MEDSWANLSGMGWMKLESHRDQLSISRLPSASQVPKTPPTMLFPSFAGEAQHLSPSVEMTVEISELLSQPTTAPQIFPFEMEALPRPMTQNLPTSFLSHSPQRWQE